MYLTMERDSSTSASICGCLRRRREKKTRKVSVSARARERNEVSFEEQEGKKWKAKKIKTHDVEVTLDPPELLPLLLKVVKRGEGDLFRLLGGLFAAGGRRERGKTEERFLERVFRGRECFF